MYRVIDWMTGEVYGEYKALPIAQRQCKSLGHTGEDAPGLTGYPPIAYVANDKGECVYNPRFSKQINAAVGGLIGSKDSSWFG